MLQSSQDLPLNTESVHNYVMEFMQKFGDFWDPGFYGYEFLFIPTRFYPFCRIDVVLISNV
jgi:hypothetical protein